MTTTHRRKAFFSKEKKQKTFMSLSRFSSKAQVTVTKVFMLFQTRNGSLRLMTADYYYQALVSD
jgi:hypothetical protein